MDLPSIPDLNLLPASSELRSLLDKAQPATVLRRLEGIIPPQLALYKAEALLELDRLHEAYDLLNIILPQLSGEVFAEAGRLWMTILIHEGWIDQAILFGLDAVKSSADPELKAAQYAWIALGYTHKRCEKLAESYLHIARELAHDSPYLLVAQARMHLEADHRLEARRIFERLSSYAPVWARLYGDWGQSYIAYLLGEFDQAQEMAESALSYSDEIVIPLFTLGQIALARGNLPGLIAVVEILAQRSPESESLAFYIKELQALQRLSENEGNRNRLVAFPTLVQRRDYCGPSTIELVLRYWKNHTEFSNDQIAEKVKLDQTGTPVYRMREFFHLVGFDTIRALVSIEKLKMLIDRGYPVIIQEEFSNTSHVTIVIGYDETEDVIELQDPMTHIATRTPTAELYKLRKIFLDAALIAFPRGQNHDQVLARLGIFDHPALVSCDQVALELEAGRLDAAVSLAERTARKLPRLGLAWVMLLHSQLQAWQQARSYGMHSMTGLASRVMPETKAREAARDRFYSFLARARKIHPGENFIFQFEGRAALVDGDFQRAQASFRRAIDSDPQDFSSYAHLSECAYAVRDFKRAQVEASNALLGDPASPSANAWMARSLVALGRDGSDHYARSAVELSPDKWLTHLSLAEALIQSGDIQAASREVELARTLAPDETEVLVQHAMILIRQGQASEGTSMLQSVLAKPGLSPAVRFQANQELCQILFQDQFFDLAIEQGNRLLQEIPGEPWTMQFLAASRFERAIQQAGDLDEASLQALKQFYRQAVEANQGNASVMHDFIHYLVSLEGPVQALHEVEALSQVYPGAGHLVFLRGILLAQVGQEHAAAQEMLTALSARDGVSNRNDLEKAIEILLAGIGPEQGEELLRKLPVPVGGVPIAERMRSLGMLMALFPAEYSERARKLLLAALTEDPEDAQVVLRLGDVALTEADREMCYQRALMLAPRWSFARANLANYLTDQGRPAEALEFTSGHDSETLELTMAHGRAQLRIALYEEAIATFDQVLAKLNKPDSSILYNYWFAQSRSGRFKAALKTARRGLKAFPEEPHWYVYLANSLRELGQVEEARRALYTGQKKGLSEADVLQTEYDICWMQEDYIGALQVLDRLAELGNDEYKDGKLGWTEEKRLHLLVMLGHLDEARQFLADKDLDAEGWGKAAWTVMLTDQPELTLELAEHALACDPENYYGLFTRAQALSDLGMEEDALLALYRLREVHPAEHNAYERIALRKVVDGDLAAALDLAENALNLGPYCPYAWATRGLVHFLMGSFTEALEDLHTGWNRADQPRRHKMTYFWWLLAVLQRRYDLAEDRHQLALEEARTWLDHRLIACIEMNIDRR